MTSRTPNDFSESPTKDRTRQETLAAVTALDRHGEPLVPRLYDHETRKLRCDWMGHPTRFYFLPRTGRLGMSTLSVTIDPALFTEPVNITITDGHLDIQRVGERPTGTGVPGVVSQEVQEPPNAEELRRMILDHLEAGDLPYQELQVRLLKIPEPRIRAALATMKGRCKKVRRNGWDMWTINP